MQSIILTTAAILFPLWGTLWEKGPLTYQDLNTEPMYGMVENDYPLLKQVLSRENPGGRRRIYSTLASAPIPANRNFLLEYCLKNEKNSELRSSILHFMNGMEPETIPAPLLENLMKDDAPAIALEAIKLYCRNPNAKAAQFIPFLGTPENRYHDRLLELAAWNALAENDAFAEELGNKILDFRKSSSPEVQQLAFRAALSLKNRNAQVNEWINEALKGTDEMRLALAQDRHPQSAKIPMTLVKDKKLVVRQAVCEASGSWQYPDVLLQALKDSTASVRIAALKSLVKSENLPSDAAEKVLALFDDKSFLVRAQAEDTFVAIAPKCEIAGLLEGGLSSSVKKMTRYHSLNAARRIGAKYAANKIASELSQKDSPEIAAASLNALAFLAERGEYSQLIISFSKNNSPLVRR